MPENIYTLVVINGIDVSTEPEATRKETQLELFQNWFPNTEIRIFDSIREQDGEIHHGYLRDKAKDIIGELHTLFLEQKVTRDKSVTFLAHNTGAALVKQILLLSLEDRRYDWLALQTDALYFVEAPSYTDYRKWEEFLFRLLSSGRLPLSNLAALIHVLPGELAHTEVEFSAIAQAYDIVRGSWSSDTVYDKEEDPWRFQKGKVKLADQKVADIINEIRGSLRQENLRLMTNYQRFYSVLSQPEAATGRLSVAYVDPRSMEWLEKHQKYKDWLGRKRASLLAIEGTRGLGKTHIASHVLYSLMTNNTDPSAVFLSFDFYSWDAKRNSEWHMLASLIRQLLILRPVLIRKIYTLAYWLSSKGTVRCPQLWDLLRCMLSSPPLSTVFIVVNAVDQCRDSVVDVFASFVSTALSKRQSIKILITGSDFASLPATKSIQRLAPGDSDWEGSVRAVVAEHVQRLVNKRPVWKEKEEKIVAKLCEGGFNYVSIMLNLSMLERSNIASTGAALEAQLMAPPMSLDHVFTTLLASVKASPMATLALRWVMNAVSPLTVSELSVALALCPGVLDYEAPMPSSFDELAESVSWDIMADLAAHLGPAVRVSNDRVMLVHHSFRAYVEEEEKALAPRFHALVASRCMSYIRLCSEFMPADTLESVRLSRPSYGKACAFLEYAELYWEHHYRLAGDSSPPLDDDVLRFLKATAAAPDVDETNHETNGDANAQPTGAEEVSRNEAATEAEEKEDENKTPETVNDGGAPQSGDKEDDSKSAAGGVETNIPDSAKSVGENSSKDESEEKQSKDKDEGEKKDEDEDEDADAKSEEASGKASDKDDDASSDGTNVSSVFDTTFPLAPPIKKWARICIAAFGWPRNIADDHLYLAVRLGFTRIVDKALLELTGSGENEIERIRTATRYAGFTGNLVILEKLLAVGDPKRSALFALPTAAGSGHADFMDRLFQELEPADVEDLKANKPTEYPASVANPLQVAAQTGQTDIVRILLKKGFQLSMKDNLNYTPVHYSVIIGDVETLKVMQSSNDEQFKETLRVGNRYGKWPIHMAVMTGNVELFAYMKEQYPEGDMIVRQPTEKGESMVQLCLACGGSLGMLEKLIAAGADVFRGGHITPIPDEFDYDTSTSLRAAIAGERSPLETAAALNSVDLVQPLLKQLDIWASADDGTMSADERLKKKKNILDSSLFEAASYGRYEIAEILLGETKRDPVMDAKHMRLAIGRGHLKVVKLLEAAGISLEDKDKDGYNGLFDLSISGEYVDELAYFISKGLKSQYDGYETSIQFAIRCGYVTCLRLLLDSAEDTPSDVRRKSSDSLTAAEVAANNCELEAFKMVTKWEVDHGLANPSEKLATAIVLAIKGYDTAERKVRFIEYLLSHDWDPNINDGGQDIPLLVAISKHESEVIQLLLNTGANPDCADSSKATALHIAVEEREVGALKMLLEKGANPNVANGDGMTPLLLAAQSGMASVFAALLGLPDATEDEYGETDRSPPPQRPIADINMRGLHNQTALHVACTQPGIIELYFDYFKKHGLEADPDPVMEETLDTPLMLAVQRGEPEAVEVLLKHGASVQARNKDGSTPLQMVSLNFARLPEEDTKIARLLVEHGADVDAAGGKFGSPLHAALWSRNGDQTILKLLLELGAKADIQAPPFGTPLHVLLMASREIEQAADTVVPLLVAHGCDVNGIGSRGRTPLMYAVSHDRSREAISKLVEAGADPNLGDVTGSRPLNYAPRHSDPAPVVRDLLDAGAKTDLLDDCGRSVLYTAALVDGASDICATIMGALPKDKVADFVSAALPAAAKSQCKETYEAFLREPEINVNVPDRSGWTALDIAETNGLDDLARALVDRGAVKGAAKRKPTKMSAHDMKSDLFVSEDGMEVSMEELTYAPFYGDLTNGTVRADHCVQPDNGIFYYEVEILERGHLGAIAVGFTQENLVLNDMVGWNTGSFGYHSDDGGFLNEDEPIDQGRPYYVGEVIGVAYDPETRRIWFSVGGEVVCKSWAVPEDAKDEEDKDNDDPAEPENETAGDDKSKEDKEGKEDNKDSDDSSDSGDESERGGGGDKTEDKTEDKVEGKVEGEDGKDRNDAGAEEGDNEGNGNGNDNGSDNGSDSGSTGRKSREPAIVQGQFYPAISLVQFTERVSVRVSFGVQEDGTGQPFRYAPPTSVPE